MTAELARLKRTNDPERRGEEKRLKSFSEMKKKRQLVIFPRGKRETLFFFATPEMHHRRTLDRRVLVTKTSMRLRCKTRQAIVAHWFTINLLRTSFVRKCRQSKNLTKTNCPSFVSRHQNFCKNFFPENCRFNSCNQSLKWIHPSPAKSKHTFQTDALFDFLGPFV